MKPITLKYYLQKLNILQLSLDSLSAEEQINYLNLIYLAHVKTFPYSNFDLRQIARQHIIQRQALSFFNDDTLKSSKNDGYCYQSAALMADALSQLGYKAEFCSARVLVGAEINAPAILALPATHLVILVTINNKEQYFLDPGLGYSAPRYPIHITGKDESIIQGYDEFKFYKHETHQVYVLEKKTSLGWLRLIQTDLAPISEKTTEMNLLKLERHPTKILIRDTKTVVGIITDTGRKTLMWDAQSNQLKFSKNEEYETTHKILASFEEGYEILKQEFNIHHVSVAALKTYCSVTLLPKPQKPWTVEFPIDEAELIKLAANLT